MTVTPPTLSTDARRSALATVCSNCDRKRPGIELVCAALDRRIIEDIVAGEPFCPIGRHDAAFLDAPQLIPITSTAAPQTGAPPVPKARSTRARRFFEAALKVLLSIVGHCRTDEVTIARRRATCAGCEERRVRYGLNLCRRCGCSIRLKTRLASERCPADKWLMARALKNCRWLRAMIALEWIGKTCGGCGHAE